MTQSAAPLDSLPGIAASYRSTSRRDGRLAGREARRWMLDGGGRPLESGVITAPIAEQPLAALSGM